MQEKWICIYIFIAGLFIYCNYVIVHIRYTDYTYERQPAYKYGQVVGQEALAFNYETKTVSKINSYAEKQALQEAGRITLEGYKKQLAAKLCCNPLLCPMKGTWRLKHDISFKELTKVLDTNMELRMRKGWPTNLYHGDLRCGKKYPLPRRIRYNNTEAYYLDIASQCDSLSNAPCCRDDIGWCGRGEWFCDCESCLNYDKIIHAELYKWLPLTPSCRLNIRHQKENCEFLQKSFSTVTFIGDSLVRHTFSSLLLHLTNDSEYGALKQDLSKKAKDYCKDENQFVDSACHIKLATNWEDIKSNKNYCSLTNERVQISFTQAYSTTLSSLAFKTVEDALQHPRPLIFIGIGVHDNFNANKVIETYLKPLSNLRKVYMNSKPIIIWLNTHAAGPLKPMSFQDTQGNDKILKFNDVMTKYCEDNAIFVFDSFNLTKGVHSFDGTHYGSSLNNLKVQLLLHGLRKL